MAVGLAYNYESAQSNYTNYTQVLMRVKDIIEFVRKDNKIDFIEIIENANYNTGTFGIRSVNSRRYSFSFSLWRSQV